MTETPNRNNGPDGPAGRSGAGADLGRIEIVFDAQEIESAVLSLGRRLRDELAGDDPLLLSLLGGSVIFLADLVRAYEDPVRYEFVDVGYTRAGGGESDLLAIHYPIPVDLAEQQVLVVKDVVSSGVTETYLAEQFRDRGAASVRFVALIDLPEERKTELDVDYHAFSLERSAPLVGYGLKHDGRYGNLPYVGRYLGDPGR
ncbi:MAG TPA: phosphoribosyltransferase family protein [Thermoanaerobaculia bacterium]